MEYVWDFNRKQLWRKPHVPEIRYYYLRKDPKGYSMNPHRHQQIEIMYVYSGEMVTEVGGEVVVLGPRKFIMITGGLVHGKHPHPKESVVGNCEFVFTPHEHGEFGSDHMLAEIRELGGHNVHWPPWSVYDDTGRVGVILQDLVESLEQNRSAVSQLMLWRLILEILWVAIPVHGPTKAVDLNVQKALKFMRSNYRNNITVQDVSEYVGIDRSHFSRIFRRDVGIPPRDFLNELRIEQAKKLLLYTDLRVEDICQEVGIGSSSSFFWLFKNYTGMTPKEFRTTHRIG